MTEIFCKNKPRQTKIIATLGPSTDNAEIISQLIDCGIDAVRMNFSHGHRKDHLRRAKIVREVSQKKHYHIGIIGDLQGPKIRIQKFKNSQVILEEGQTFTLSAESDKEAGDEKQVGITYSDLYKDIKEGDELLLDDGRVSLKVESSAKSAIVTTVLIGGVLSDNKGLNRKGGGLSAPSITEKDKKDIQLAVEMDVDYLAISFVKTADDITYARKLLREAGGEAQIIAKVERVEALQNMDKIMEVSDGVMIARGDLSIEIGDAELTGVQKSLIKKARQNYCIAITATEMLQSMIESNVPTRAEISDVANAVLDGSDALMLSAESAVGKYPIEAVKTMSRLCQGAERAEPDTYSTDHLLTQKVDRVDKAVALSTVYTSEHLQVKFIAALTESGSTALYISRFRSNISIYAMTTHIKTCRKVTLYKRTYPLLLEEEDRKAKVTEQVVKALGKYQAIESGDKIVVTKGDDVGILGGTNGMKIIIVP